MRNEIESVIKKNPTKKNPAPDDFTFFSNYSKKLKERKLVQTYSLRMALPQCPYQMKFIRKENYRPISLKSTVHILSIKCQSVKSNCMSQLHAKLKWTLSQGCKGGFNICKSRIYKEVKISTVKKPQN
jgi:hypothetical protein